MTVDESPLESFRRCWTGDCVMSEEDIRLYPDMAFVYALPKINADAQDIKEWAEDNVQIWMRHFRVHFRPAKGKSDKLIRRPLSTSAEDDGESFEDSQDPLYWRNLQPWSIRSYEWCLTHLGKLGKAESIAAILPPAIQLAEDHGLDARAAGTRCLMHLVKIEPALVIRMGLADLILEILKTNLSFHESVELLTSTFDCLELLLNSACTTPPLPGWRRPCYSQEYFDLLDEFMEIVLKDLSVAKPSAENFDILIESLRRIVILEQLGSIRFLSPILTLIDEMAKYTTLQSLQDLYETVKSVCSPRIHCHKDLSTSIEQRLNL